MQAGTPDSSLGVAPCPFAGWLMFHTAREKAGIKLTPLSSPVYLHRAAGEKLHALKTLSDWNNTGTVGMGNPGILQSLFQQVIEPGECLGQRMGSWP